MKNERLVDRAWFRGAIGGVFLLSLFSCGARTGIDAPRPDGASPCVAVSEEVCNAVDDDCDGAVDEGVMPVVCGPELCPTVVQCESGVIPECVPRSPSDEACNLQDDDCDGRVDEGLGFGPLGDTHTVRQDEFDTGTCSSCSWAFGTALAPTSEGIMAYWYLGLSGGRERPNYYRRLLDERGRPVGPIELARDDYILHTNPVSVVGSAPPAGVPLETTFRVGRDDISGLLFLGGGGETQAVYPLGVTGPRNVSRVVWSGERLVGVRLAGELQVMSFAPDGTDERSIDIASGPTGIGAVTLGVYPRRIGALVAFVRESGEREQWLYLFNGRGEFQSVRELDLEYRSWQRLIGLSDGWLYVVPGRAREPSRWQLWTVEGEPRTRLIPFEDGRAISDAGYADQFLSLPEQREVLMVWSSPWGQPDSDLHVEYRTESGEIARAWSGPLPVQPDPDQAYFGDPHVLLTETGFLLLWHAGADDHQGNPVYAREFGCIP